MKNRYGPRGYTQAMNIDYSTLTITQSEDSNFDGDDSAFSALELLNG